MIVGSVSTTLLNSALTYCVLSLGFNLTERIYEQILVLLPVAALTGALIGLASSYVVRSDWVVVVSACLGWLIGMVGGTAISFVSGLRDLTYVIVVLMGVIAGSLLAVTLGRLLGAKRDSG